MKKITDKWSINIIITNHCKLNCLYCTQYIRHLRDNQRFNMNLYEFEYILMMLKGWPNRINIFGGEPTLHPQFNEICKLARRYFSKRKLQLFTYGGMTYREHQDIIKKTFKYVYINPHSQNRNTCRHQPLTIAINEVIKDERLRDYLIENCWVDRTWCCTIKQYGFYFCEVAAVLDALLFNGQNALPLYDKWFKDADCSSQKELCQYCGMAIPMQRDLISQKKERFTPRLLQMLKEKDALRVDEGWIEIFDKQFTLDEIRENALTWYPGNFREDRFNDENCHEGLGIPNFNYK